MYILCTCVAISQYTVVFDCEFSTSFVNRVINYNTNLHKGLVADQKKHLNFTAVSYIEFENAAYKLHKI